MGKSKQQWFRAAGAKAPPTAVNEAAGVIEGVSLVTAGEALGHGVWLDTSFIEKTVELGNAMAVGVKARFGHPNMSNEALGTYLGRWKNFRQSDDGTQAIADLHIDETAYNTPNGDLAGYVMSLARTSPEMFGASIVFSIGDYYVKKKDGTPASDNTKQEELETDANGSTKNYVTITQLYGADMVDEPAANENGLFSAKFTTQLFATRATTFLEENPDIAEWLIANHADIGSFIEKYTQNNPNNIIMDDQQVAAYEKKLSASEKQISELTEKLSATEKQISELTEKLSASEKQISELGKTPAVTIAQPQGGDHQHEKVTDFSLNPWNVEAASIFPTKKTINGNTK